MEVINKLRDFLLSRVDSDGDGSITINDAKLALVSALDADGDGHVSFDEVEQGAINLYDSVEEVVVKTHTALKPFRGLLTLAFGGFVVLFGKNFTYLIMFGQVFRVSGWPVMSKAASQLAVSYKQTRKTLKQELPTLQQAALSIEHLNHQLEEAKVVSGGARASGDAAQIQAATENLSKIEAELKAIKNARSSLTTLSKCVDPAKLADVFKGLYGGLMACAATAMSTAAAKVGVGLNLGNVVAETINGTVRPFVVGRVTSAVQASKYKELSSEGETQRWIDYGVRAICGGVTVMLTSWFESKVFLVANAVSGAELMVNEVNEFAKAKGVGLERTPLLVMLQYLLVGAGVYRQLLGKGDLPSLARKLLFLPLFAERVLRVFVGSVRV